MGMPAIEGETPEASRRAGWLVTLVDLITLLLCFFIVSAATTTLPEPVWQAARQSLHTAFATTALRPRDNAITAAEGSRDPAYLAAAMAAARRSAAGDDTAVLPEITASGGRVVLAFPCERVFYPQSGEITPEGARMLAGIVPYFDRLALTPIIVVEAAGEEPDWQFALRRGGAVRQAIAFGFTGNVDVYAVPGGGERRFGGNACAAAGVPGDRGDVVLCLTGSWRCG
jgi:chemotaxis protein MotB